MKRLFSSSVLLSLTILLASCEVFKTTPRSSPEYRGPGARTSGSTQRKPVAAPSDSDRPTLVGRMSEKREKPNTAKNTAARKSAATTRSRPSGNNSAARRNNTATTNRSSTPHRTASARPDPAKKEPAGRPTGPSDANAPEVVQIARTYTGTPYRSGGNDKGGIDCSGLICQVYTEMGMKVPRISWQQSEFGREVDQIKDIKPGDWIFFVPEGGKEGYVSHSGIVTEVRGERDIVFIHASSSRGVIEDNLFSTYFRNRFVKAMRPF